jgi:Ca2+-binding EF-hand superfamily protein
LGAVFDVLDTDGDGFVGAGDFAVAGRRVTDEFGVTGDASGVALEHALRSWWEQLSADCGGDGTGRIGRDEFIAAFVAGAGQPPAYYQRLFGPVVAASAQVIDPGGDGFTEVADYVRAFAAHGVRGEFSQAAFQSLDADRDGRVSVAEFGAGLANVFLSQDHADPGTGLLGQA